LQYSVYVTWKLANGTFYTYNSFQTTLAIVNAAKDRLAMSGNYPGYPFGGGRYYNLVVRSAAYDKKI